MMNTEPTKPVPEKLDLMLYSDLKLVQDTRDQLQKDLQKTGWDGSLEYQPENALESLTELVASILKSYLERDSQRFFRLMYVLDLDEKKVMNLLEQPDSFRLLAHMTIMRECMKVILRKNFG
jgi:hypothetical protein